MDLNKKILGLLKNQNKLAQQVENFERKVNQPQASAKDKIAWQVALKKAKSRLENNQDEIAKLQAKLDNS